MNTVTIRHGETRPAGPDAVALRIDVEIDHEYAGSPLIRVWRRGSIINADSPVAWAMARVLAGDFVLHPERLARALTSGEHTLDTESVRWAL